MKLRSFWHGAILVLLVACGGGSSDNPTPNNAGGGSQSDSRSDIQLTLSGSGAVTSNLGHNCSNSCTLNLTNQTQLQLSAVPATGFQFSGWSGACSGNASCTLALSSGSQLNVSAAFSPITQYQISLRTQNGSVIMSTEGGQNSCTADCTYTVSAGSRVVLNAIAAAGYVFAGWEGPGCTSNAECALTVNGNQTMIALFKPAYNVSIQTAGDGIVRSPQLETPCRGSCQLSLSAGDYIELTAVPDEGQLFSGWIGSTACDSTPVCRLPLAAQVSITASFRPVNTTPDAENIVTLSNPHNSVLTQYPLQFGRRFAEGEISEYPQMLLNGVPLPTQADVKQRHSDGSVRHAILSAVVPQIAAGAQIKISFINQSTGRNTARLTKTQMLADNFDFDARMQATFAADNVKTVSARDMLLQDKFSYWLEGDIATTVLLVDHSAERLFDFGSDQYRSVRPAFYATFWPGINRVQIRYVAEVTNTEAMQDQAYDISLDSGLVNRQQQYQKAAVPHQAMTRWTKQFWHGQAPLPVSLDHNLAYLAKIKVLPNFDASLKIPEATIVSEYAKWTAANKDLYDAGFWQRRMGTAGGRGELGLYPSWTVQWIYSGDWRLAEIALRSSELTGAWPMHVREGDSSRTFDKARSISGLGRILSINQGGRPMAWIPRLDWHEIPAADKIIPLRPLIATEWRPDNPHHPDYATPQYILTGDYYYLEQMLFSAAYTSMDNNARGINSTLGRGPTGSEGALYSNEIRAQAWNFRTRIHAVDIAPDDIPEREYLKQLALNAIAMWDGLYNLKDSAFYQSELWNFSRQIIANTAWSFANGEPSPLGFWKKDVERAPDFTAEPIDFNKILGVNTGFMTNYTIIVLGRAQELGYPTESLLRYIGRTLIEPVKVEGYAFELLSAYWIPSVRRIDGQWIDNWAEVRDGFKPSHIEEIVNRYQNEKSPDLQHGYNLIVFAASSYLTNDRYGRLVYEYYRQLIMRSPVINSNPKWALTPR